MKLAVLTQAKRISLIAFGIFFLLSIAVNGCSSLMSDSSYRSSAPYDATEDFSDIEWPDTDLAKMLPEPESKYGEIITDSAKSLYVNIGNVDEQQYDSYVKACTEKGFSIDHVRTSLNYSADNEEGYSLNLSYYSDDGYMSIMLNAPVPESDSSSSGSVSNESANAEAAAQADAEASSQPEAQQPGDAPVNGIRPSFKEAVDSYEAFIDEYCAFMEKYNEAGNPATMLVDYTKFVTQYTETMSKIDALADDSTTPEEDQYYLDALNRINAKLTETAVSLG